MLTIVDYGVGNLASIQNMLKKLGVPSVISSEQAVIEKATRIILPGVGAFDTCSEKLQQSGLTEILNQKALQERVPLLGVCVGMQLLLNGSEEGQLPGLGWIKGRNIRFRKEQMPSDYKIPHMSWTDVRPVKSARLLQEMEEPRFYFVHSYHAQLDNAEDGLIEADYGYSFIAGVERDNILGVQFHPEKSHKFGMKLLQNFVKLY
jgi:glutamine amidotransferase